MKEPVTKFDLNAAFKALDDIPVPVAEKGIAANRVDIEEATKRVSKTDLLVEEYYDVRNTTELEEAADEREAEVAKAKLARIEKIVDLDAESEDDLLPSYAGKIIIQCPQCMTLFYKNPEDIEVAEESDDVVNINEVCQHCGNASGYTVIGRVEGIDEAEAANYEAAEDLAADDEDLNELDLDFDLDDEEIPEEEVPEEETEAEDEAEEEEEEETSDEEEEEVKESVESKAGTALTEEVKPEEADIVDTTREGETSEEETEQLTEDTDVSDETFKKLINSPEFKQDISEDEVNGYLDEAMEDTRDEELEEGIKDFFKNLGRKFSGSKAQDVTDNVGSAVKGGLTDINTKAINIASEVVGSELNADNSYKNYCFYVIPYKKNSEGARSYAEPDATKSKIFGLNNYKSAEAYALNLSKQATEYGDVVIYLGERGKTVKTFVYADNKINGTVVHKHEYTFADYMEGKNGVDKAIDVRYREYLKNQALKKRQEKAGGEGVEAGDDEGTVPTGEEEQPKDNGGDQGDSEENQKPKVKRTRAPKAPTQIAPVEGKYNIVYGTSKNPKLIVLDDEVTDDEAAKALAQGKSLGKATAVLITKDNKKFKFKDGQPVDAADTYVGVETVFESLEDIDEESLETCLTESLTNVYDNVKSFKLTGCSLKEGKLALEGNIVFNSGKALSTVYTFDKTRYNESLNRLVLKGVNERFADSTFKLIGTVEDNKTKFFVENVQYKYSTGDNLVEGYTGKPKASK